MMMAVMLAQARFFQRCEYFTPSVCAVWPLTCALLMNRRQALRTPVSERYWDVSPTTSPLQRFLWRMTVFAVVLRC
jgi:hypothetical protein